MVSGAQGAQGRGVQQGQQEHVLGEPAGAQRHGGPACLGWEHHGLGWEAVRMMKTEGQPGLWLMAH